MFTLLSVAILGELKCICLCLQTFQYLVWYMVMSMLGHYNNFFYACHLLDIAMGVKTLRTILSSVTHNGKQVLLDHCGVRWCSVVLCMYYVCGLVCQWSGSLDMFSYL